MKQKYVEKVKTNLGQTSNKGRRKLEFSKQLPLSGKIIYLDVKDVRQTRTLEGKIQQLGGVVEKFLIKEVNYVISNNAPTTKPRRTDKGLGTADSPVQQSTPSPFNMGQSPSPGPPENKKETVTRGKAMLQIAKHKSSHTNVIDTALKMNIKIVALDAAIKWIEKEMLKIKPIISSSSNKHTHKKKTGMKVQRLKTPFVKFEASNCHYRPLMSQLETWPRCNVETLAGTCPFDGRALGRPQNSERGDREDGGAGGVNILSPGTPQAQRDELSGTPQPTKSQSKTTKVEENSNCKLFGVPIVTAGEIKREKDRRKREAKRKGYCECCKEKYEDVDKHLRGEQHKNFVRNKKNFDALDRLINKGPNTVLFLQKILLTHCVQQAARKPNSQQECEENVELIQEPLASPELAPEQLRVGRKVGRKQREYKPDQSHRLSVKIDKATIRENHEHVYSSPSKPRSGSFPRAGDSNSTAAVVIRRSGSRGIYGSPRRPNPNAVTSEKTLVIRDSPIASLQPLRDFLNKHSSRAGSENSICSANDNSAKGIRKRKSDSSQESPDRKRKHKRSGITSVESSMLTDSKIAGDSKLTSPCIVSLLNEPGSGPSVQSADLASLSQSPSKKLKTNLKTKTKVESPRKSKRLCSSTQSVDSQNEEEDQTVKAKYDVNMLSDSLIEKDNTQEAKDSDVCDIKTICEADKPRKRKNRSKSGHRISDGSASQCLDKPTSQSEIEIKVKEKELTNLGNQLSPLKCSTNLDSQTSVEVVGTVDKDSNLKQKKDKRKKWKKSNAKSSKTVKGRKLDKLKLDESLCSDISLPSLTPQKAQAISQIHLSDSSSPTFKKKKPAVVADKPDAIPVLDSALSPIFKRRSRRDVSQESDLEKTPTQNKNVKKKEATSEVDTPKSGYSLTPRRPLRSQRNIELEYETGADVLDKTLCEEDLENRLQAMPADIDEPVGTSPTRRSKRGIDSQHQDHTVSRRSRSRSAGRKGREKDSSNEQIIKSNVYLSPSKSRTVIANIHNSPSKSNAVIAQTHHSPSKSRNIIAKTNHSPSKSRSDTRGPVQNETKPGLRKSPRKASKVEPLSEAVNEQSKKTKKKWRRCNSDTKPSKKVKLNRSWLILSDRSLSKLLESEDDQEPFLGFNKEQPDANLPSDMTYEEVSEVDMSEDSMREWIIDDLEDEAETLDKTLMAETSLVSHFFPSPDKASNSSWGDACDSFLKSACEKKMKADVCSTPLLLGKERSPCRKRKVIDSRKGEKNAGLNVTVQQESHSTPRKIRKASKSEPVRTSGRKTRFSPIKFDDSEVKVDKDIVFNFNSSPKRGKSFLPGTRKLFNKSPDKPGLDKGKRLLKNASDIKKSFTLTYGKQPKSPKPRRKVEIEAGKTVIIVSPNRKHE